MISSGIQNIMLLRGDPPAGKESFSATSEGFSYANELISHVVSNNSFCIGAAAYPEKHPEAESIEDDIAHLATKVTAGADFLITQLFFDNDVYFNFVNKVREKGINCKIIPGIIPVTSYGQINRFVEMTGANFPPQLMEKLLACKNNPEQFYRIGIEHAICQCSDLLLRGAPGIHFYTLNKSRAAVEVFESLKIR